MKTLREKIQALAETTASKEVKSLCENLLSKKVITQVEFEQVLEKQNPMRTATQSLEDAKMAQSKAAAARLMESWNGKPKKVSNVGFEGKEEIDPLEVKNVSEQMIAIGGASGVKASKAILVDYYGIAEGIASLKNSDVVKRFTEIRYAIERFDRDLKEGVSESSMARTFISTMNNFNWDKNVAAVLAVVESRVNEAGLKLDVQNTMQKVKSSDAKNFFGSAINAMNMFVTNESSQAGLIRDLKPWAFNNHVKDLLNKISLLENESGKGIPTQYDAKAKEVHSPVLFAKGVKIFKAGKNFFGYNDNAMFRLSQQQINALPKDFHDIAEAFSMPYVNVADGNIVVRVGDAKAVIGDTLSINGKEVNEEGFARMLSVASNNTLRRTNEEMKTAMYLLERKDEIYNIDFAKHITSTVYEGFEAYLFRVGDKIFINKINEGMKEDKLFGASGTKAVRYIKENFGLDISSTITDIITDNSKKNLQITESINKLVNEVNILEGNIQKLNKAIETVGSEPELLEAKNMVEDALTNARAQWNKLAEEKEEAEELVDVETTEDNEEMVDMDLDFDVQVEPTGNGKFELTVTAKPKEENPKEEEPKEESEEEEKEEEEESEEEESEESEEEEKPKDKNFIAEFNESLGLNAKVKLKGSNKEGVISGETDGTYVVTWEDGSSSDHVETDLEGVDVETDLSIANNELAADEFNMGEDAMDNEIEIAAADNADIAADIDGDTFIDVKVNADFGAYKVGDIIKVSASQLTASGDEDSIATETGDSIIKKFIDLEDTSKADAPADIKSRLDAAMAELDAIKQLADEGGISIDISGVIANLQGVASTLDTNDAPIDGDVMINDPMAQIGGEQSDAVIEVPADVSVNVDVISADGEDLQVQSDAIDADTGEDNSEEAEKVEGEENDEESEEENEESEEDNA